MNSIPQILEKALLGGRILRDEALYLLRNAPWSDLIEPAHQLRSKKNGATTASFTHFRVINYTNVCSIGCTFCSFHRSSDHAKAYVLEPKDILQKVEEGVNKGAHQVFFQGGVNRQIPLTYYLDILASIKSKFSVHIRAFSPVELVHLANQAGLELATLLEMLKEAGLDSVPGAGAEMLVERVRRILSPEKLTTSEWVETMKLCHRHGLTGSANMVFGSIETPEEIIEHLDVIRSLQDETAGFHAFIPWTFQPQTKKFKIRNVLPLEYLKIVALSRLYLDNIQNIEISVLGLGKDLGALALYCGGNDISSPVIEENVMRSFGIRSEEEAIAFLRESGFQARKRDFSYKIVQEYPSDLP